MPDPSLGWFLRFGKSHVIILIALSESSRVFISHILSGARIAGYRLAHSYTTVASTRLVSPKVDNRITDIKSLQTSIREHSNKPILLQGPSSISLPPTLYPELQIPSRNPSSTRTMSCKAFTAAVDQGTTSSRFLIFDPTGTPRVGHQEEFPQIYPHSGWIEHRPYDILNSVRLCIDKAMEKFIQMGYKVEDIKALGITNQRETTVGLLSASISTVVGNFISG